MIGFYDVTLREQIRCLEEEDEGKSKETSTAGIRNKSSYTSKKN